MTAEEERLHAFVLQVAERLYLAAEVLSIRAERRQPKQEEPAGEAVPSLQG